MDVVVVTILDIVVFFGGTAMTNVTQILSQIESGDPTASELFLALVYSELRRLIAGYRASTGGNSAVREEKT